MEDDFLDDGIDNLHRQYMPVLLLILDVFLGIKQFVGDPIECYVPNGLSGKIRTASAAAGRGRCRHGLDMQGMCFSERFERGRTRHIFAAYLVWENIKFLEALVSVPNFVLLSLIKNSMLYC